MSEHICAFTNRPAVDPVVSTISGHIFDRSAIEQHLESESVCPITNKPLTKDDLIPLTVNKPTKEKANGVSAVINVFQNEWDSAMLESFALKQNLDIVRKELSHALYQYDAACRTVARLAKEKDEAKLALAQFKNYRNQALQNIGDGGLNQGGAKEFSEKMIRDIYDLRIELHRQRVAFEQDEKAKLAHASHEMVLNYKLTNSVTLHSEQNPGITCVDINTGFDDLVLTGGKDGSVIFFNRAQDKVLSTFTKHTKAVTGVKFALKTTKGAKQVVGISASEDGIGYGFTYQNETGQVSEYYKYDGHKGALTGCAVHPISYLGIFASRDGSFSCHDLAEGKFLCKIALENNTPITTMEIHPDGEIGVFACEDGSVKVWNIPQLTQIGQFKAHEGRVNSVSFSEDGRLLATSSLEEKNVKLWDLRKLGDDTYRILSDNVNGTVSFDSSGRYLAVGDGANLLLYNARTLDQITKISAHQSKITSIKFGNYSKYIATVSEDRHLNIFA